MTAVDPGDLSIAASELPAPPVLEFRAPDCPLCGTETSWDEGFACYDCQVRWPEKQDERGEFLDPDDERCGAIHGSYLPGGKFREQYASDELVRCARPASHDNGRDMHAGTDQNGFERSWFPDYSATAEQLAEVGFEIPGAELEDEDGGDD